MTAHETQNTFFPNQSMKLLHTGKKPSSWQKVARMSEESGKQVL